MSATAPAVCQHTCRWAAGPEPSWHIAAVLAMGGRVQSDAPATGFRRAGRGAFSAWQCCAQTKAEKHKSWKQIGRAHGRSPRHAGLRLWMILLHVPGRVLAEPDLRRRAKASAAVKVGKASASTASAATGPLAGCTKQVHKACLQKVSTLCCTATRRLGLSGAPDAVP